MVTLSDQTNKLKKFVKSIRTAYHINIGKFKSYRKSPELLEAQTVDLLICSNFYYFYKLGIDSALKKKTIKIIYHILLGIAN